MGIDGMRGWCWRGWGRDIEGGEEGDGGGEDLYKEMIIYSLFRRPGIGPRPLVAVLRNPTPFPHACHQ